MEKVPDLTNTIRLSELKKSIWLYTGYEWQYIFNHLWHHPQTHEKLSAEKRRRQRIVSQCDILVDGQYLADEKDLSLKKWCGSSNQRVIDIQKTLRENRIILYAE